MSTLESLHRCAGNYRIVWECVFAYDHSHRVADGYSGDSKYSHTTREQATWHVSAPNIGLARAAWLFHHPVHVGYELVSCDPVCVLDAELKT